ncbi:hypothetical protein B7P43_G09751 [Cryptotermes secundus]|uniref:Ig-like domain-containing protein n=1 Tax=Cryptotermes secundus TaxID=105785 RepID=A0A2J7RSJ3_9NEOP|nr:hypothetical protein B7P43_G09751 [Cryptotermes secundus]
MYALKMITVQVLLLSSGPCSAREPYFRSVPTTVKTSENDTVLLPCYVNDLGYNAVRWWWENQLVADSSNPGLVSSPRIKMLPNNTLQVSDLQAEDTGEYKCQIIRPEPWGPIQQVHAIEVLYPPSVTPIPEEGLLEVQLGEEVVMGCSASGVPHPIVTWSNEGEEMQLLDNRPILRFQAHTRHLAGLYQCIAINGVGSPATATIQLRILFPPEIEVERPWVHAAPGIRSELVCNVLADPDAKVIWLKNDVPVITSTRVVELSTKNKYTLLLRTVHPLDFGYFKCRAMNELGVNEKIIQLSGVANPAIFKNESGVPSETNYTLIWEVDSYSSIIEYNLLFQRYSTLDMTNMCFQQKQSPKITLSELSWLPS